MQRQLRLAALLLLPTFTAMLGCASSSAESEDAAVATDEKSGVKKAADSLIKPFDPPSLVELDAKVTWIEQPVVDSMELARQDFAQRGRPKLSAAEALERRNIADDDSNELIVDALGRLPESDDEVDWNATLVRRISGDINATNPLLSSSAIDSEVNGFTSFGLFSFDWRMQAFAVSDAVVSWHTSDDGLYDKLVLRDDLVWSDGHPLTAHDIVFSFETIMNPKVPAVAIRDGTDKIRWIEAYDDQTLVYFHEKPSPVNIWNLNFSVIPKHKYEKTVSNDESLVQSAEHIELENAPITCGPYDYKKRVRGQEIVLERRESWYMHNGKQVRDKPYFKRVIFRIIVDPNTALLALKSGNIDDCALTAEQWKTQSNDDSFYQRNTKASGLEWVYFYLGWNCESPFFSDVRVRRAMTLTFDHREMIDIIFYKLYTQCAGVFHESAQMAPVPPLPVSSQDLDKAETLLDEAGWDDSDGDGVRDKEIDGRLVPFEFTMIMSQSPNSLKVGTLMKESLDRIGILCHVRPLEWTVMQQKTQDHEYHAMMGGWGTGTDPYTMRNLWYTGADRNYAMYGNPIVDEIFDEAEKVAAERKPWNELLAWKSPRLRSWIVENFFQMEKDDPQVVERSQQSPGREERMKLYTLTSLQLYEDQPYTWLFFRSSFYGFSKELRGYRFSPRGPYSYSPGPMSLWKPKTKSKPN